MNFEYDVHEIHENKLRKALKLINRVFDEFVAVDYSEEGIKTFKDFASYDFVLKMMDDGVLKVWGVSDHHRIVGVIATRDINHISMFFVDKEYQHKGIGKALFDKILSYNIQNNQQELTVNSSPYAVRFYHSVGFIDTDTQKEMDGIIFTPMKLTL